MTVKFKLCHGNRTTFVMIPGIKWHDSYRQNCGAGLDDLLRPAGHWIRESELRKFMEMVNQKEIEWSGSVVFRAHGKRMDEILECAEVPVEVYDDDTNEEPWRHNGTLRMTVHRDHDDKFWYGA